MTQTISALLQRFLRAAAADNPPTEILLAGSRDDDSARLYEILAANRWSLIHIHDWDDALRAQKHHAFPIVLLDRDLCGLRWRAAVRTMLRAEGSPTVLLISNVAGPYLRDEVGQSGGFELLVRPFQRQATLALLESAVRSRLACSTQSC